MGAGAGKSGASGSSPRVKPGTLTALLKEIAGAPEEAQGGAWEGVLRPGAVVGRFELVRELGHGGFGVVWKRATGSSAGASPQEGGPGPGAAP